MNRPPASITSDAASRPAALGEPVGDEDRQRALQQVVVERAEELRDEERREPARSSSSRTSGDCIGISCQSSGDRGPRRGDQALAHRAHRRTAAGRRRRTAPAGARRRRRARSRGRPIARASRRRRSRCSMTVADRADRRGRVSAASLPSWPCCTNSRNRNSSGLSSCAWQKPRIIAASLPRAVDSPSASARRLRRELDVVPLEELPDQLLFADEVPIERTFGDIDRAGDIADRGFGDALLDEQVDGGGFDAVAGVGESVSWHSE